MIAFMLHDTGMETLDATLEPPTRFVMPRVINALPAWHPAAQSRHRKAALPALLFLVAEGCQFGIDQDGLWYRRRFGIARIRLAAEDHDPQIDTDLRRRQAGAIEMRHGVAHVAEKFRQLHGAELRNRSRNAQQPRIAHAQNFADHSVAAPPQGGIRPPRRGSEPSLRAREVIIVRRAPR